MLVLPLLTLSILAPQATPASAPVASAAPAQESASTDAALEIHWAGLDAWLSDPRDRGLLSALQTADDRLVQLAGTTNWDGPPAPMMRLLFDMLDGPARMWMHVPEEPQGVYSMASGS